MTITISPPASGTPWGPWEPEIGERTRQFVKSRATGKRPVDMETVLQEAKSILSRCVPPTSAVGGAVVLVVGYVQSGKTLSFTTLASLARDNGYGAVILLAGTTNNLK